jgi:hypothetical protein
MKLTPQRARELRQKGVNISPGQIVRPKVEQKPAEPIQAKPEPKQDIATIEHLINIMEINVENTREVIKLNEKMMDKIIEPKPLKKWRCSVGRSGGSISTIDIKEVI